MTTQPSQPRQRSRDREARVAELVADHEESLRRVAEADLPISPYAEYLLTYLDGGADV